MAETSNQASLSWDLNLAEPKVTANSHSSVASEVCWIRGSEELKGAKLTPLTVEPKT